MSAVVEASLCSCGSIGRSDLRQCLEHFHIWRGDKRLTSISRVLELWPQEPCSSCGWPIYSAHLPNCLVKQKIDNANERGKQTDTLLSEYVVGRLQRIPKGTRIDAVALFEKARRWFDRQGFRKVESQVLLADEEVAGRCDLRLDGMIVDLKCVWELRASYAVQIGGYCALDGNPFRDKAAILHVTERFPEAKLIPLKMPEIVEDWKMLRAAWAMIQRRAKQ